MTISYKTILDPQIISQMTTDEIYNRLTAELDCDDYAIQEKSMVPFKGSKLAERLELFLFTCPHCSITGKLASRKDLLFCSHCGYTVRYDEYGFFGQVSDTFYFNNPQEWNKWQLAHLESLLLDHSSGEAPMPLFDEKNVIIKKGNRSSPLKKLHVGHMELYHDRIQYTSLAGRVYQFKLDGIQGINVQSNKLFEFYYEKTLFTFSFKAKHASAYKWVESVSILKNKSVKC